ncbi:MAG: ZIP family metal transporter [Bacteroidales bacterium]|nr:ZIP family metal transporter [Bacteroidales bacterium]
MDIIILIIALFLGSIGSVSLAGLMLLLKNDKLEKFSTWLMYLAGGTLLGAAFLGMIPKIISITDNTIVFYYITGGIMFFFIMEKVILWRSCHNKECERHIRTAVPIILIGDAFHNAMDGIVIAASFLTSGELGIFATISVILHEIPQELGDFGILIRGGLNRKKALFYNMLSGSTAIISGIIAYYTLETISVLIPYVLAFSAASFIYIALADLIPEMHRKTSIKDSLLQIFLIFSGILIIYLILKIK